MLVFAVPRGTSATEGSLGAPGKPNSGRPALFSVEWADIDRFHAAVAARLYKARLHHHTSHDGRVQHQPETQVRPLGRCFNNLPDHRKSTVLIM